MIYIIGDFQMAFLKHGVRPNLVICEKYVYMLFPRNGQKSNTKNQYLQRLQTDFGIFFCSFYSNEA